MQPGFAHNRAYWNDTLAKIPLLFTFYLLQPYQRDGLLQSMILLIFMKGMDYSNNCLMSVLKINDDNLILL